METPLVYTSPPTHDIYDIPSTPYIPATLLYIPLTAITAPSPLSRLNNTSPIRKSVLESIAHSFSVLPPPPPLSTPMRRRHSVASLTPNSSPTSKPPPSKKHRPEPPSSMSVHLRSNLFSPPDPEFSFLITPPNWKLEPDILFDDLFDTMSQTWWKYNADIMGKSFNLESWTDDFIELGFHPKLLIAFQSMLNKWDEKFGCDIVEVILNNETVGDIVEAFLEGEVNYHSYQKTAAVSHDDTATAPDPKNETISSQSSSTLGQQQSSSSAQESHPVIRRKSDDDGDDEPPDPSIVQMQPSGTEPMHRPSWVMEFHRLAREHHIHLVFSDRDVMEGDGNSLSKPFVEWTQDISDDTIPAYHGCYIPEGAIAHLIPSFIKEGVQMRGNRRGYYSVFPAVYYTNSIQYSHIWPVMKSDLSGWRYMNSLPPPSLLIVVSEPHVGDLQGKFSTTIIPQTATRVVAEYVNATKNKKKITRVKHPDFPIIDSCDFILAPLPAHTINVMRQSEIGHAMDEINAISSISILTAATSEAVQYMNTKITKIIVLGWGKGSLGMTDHIEFGTAGIKDGETKWRGADN